MDGGIFRSTDGKVRVTLTNSHDVRTDFLMIIQGDKERLLGAGETTEVFLGDGEAAGIVCYSVGNLTRRNENAGS